MKTLAWVKLASIHDIADKMDRLESDKYELLEALKKISEFYRLNGGAAQYGKFANEAISKAEGQSK